MNVLHSHFAIFPFVIKVLEKGEKALHLHITLGLNFTFFGCTLGISPLSIYFNTCMLGLALYYH
jgi:hypothetical protein